MPAQPPKTAHTGATPAPPPTAPARDALRSGDPRAASTCPASGWWRPQLCERFGTSRFNVRAALQDLAAEGLVEVQRNKGAHVRKISHRRGGRDHRGPDGARGLVAARAATLVTDEQASELDEIGLLMRRAVTAGEFRRYSDLNQRLHALIRTIAGHRTADRSSRRCAASWCATSSRCRCCPAVPPSRCRSTNASSRRSGRATPRRPRPPCATTSPASSRRCAASRRSGCVMSTPQTVAVLGLGEAGRPIATGLVRAGAVVRGYDPRVTATGGVIDSS